MYAIFTTGGKQYKVKKGDVIKVELLEGEEGKIIDFKEVIMLFDGKQNHFGKSTLKGHSVKGKLLGTVKGPKIDSLKYKPTQYRRFGHRQKYSKVEITQVHHS